MGLTMGTPWKVFLAELFSDPVKLLKTVITFWYLKLTSWRRRLDIFRPMKPKTLVNIGFAISETEKELELPEVQLPLHGTDSVLMIGSNSSGDILMARICREQEGHVTWLMLEMSDGYTYQLPNHEKIFPPGPEFMAGGLRIKCHVPMRRWRISYNGFLRQMNKEDDETRTVHAKFSFLCISTGFPFDAFQDIHPSILAKYLVNENPSTWFQNPRKVTKQLNRYVQPVSIIGTISVDRNDETEMYLLGVKHRARDFRTCRHISTSSLFEFLGYSKDGQLIYTGKTRPASFNTELEYGHYMERCGLSWPVISCKQGIQCEDNRFNGMEIDIQTERSSISLEVSPPSFNRSYPAGISKGHVSHVHLSSFETGDGDTGRALIINHEWTQHSNDRLSGPEWRLAIIDVRFSTDTRLLLPLYDPVCQESALTGGKGSSLATLTHLATNFKTNFQVPGGFVVTTSAYKEFFKKSGIKDIVQQFEKTALTCGKEKRNESCQNLVNHVSKAKLPSSIEDAIRRQLMEQFPNPGQKRFAVRSSAAGEDSEEMSAAGQMSTLLGVQGIDNVLQAVVKCWASQFSFTAVEYKRQNGQELNSLMAVVVQEMVPADLAGVLFTCDPVTGNPENVTITGNFGIGESVVAASAEPDTVVLQRDDKNQLTIKMVQIGKKRTIIVMADDGDVEEKATTEYSDVCCISQENSCLLAEACLKIEEAYGFPVDVEWAFKDNQLFMLQARPVTTFDKETNFELAHAIDTGIRVENEFVTKANIGEVMPGALSCLGQTYFGQITGYMFYDLYKHRNPYAFPFNPFQRPIIVSQNNSFFSLPNMILRFYKKGKPSFLSDANVIAGFGRQLDDKEIFDQADKRNRSYPSTFIPYQVIFFIKDLLFTEGRTKKSTKQFWNEEIDLKNSKNSKEMYLEIMKRCADTVYAPSRHLDNTLNSSIYNGLTMSILVSANKGLDLKVFTDFATVLSSCGNLESADIPFSIELLLREIQKEIDVHKFKKMDVKDALEWLETTRGSAQKMFKEFIRKHGHRGLKEYDIYSKPWGMDKLPLVQVIQDSVNQSKTSEKKNVSTSEIIKGLKTQLSWKEKLALRILIPLSQRAVCNRELGKSLITKHFDFARRGFWKLAEQMEKEGRLPDKDLMFYLSEFEILQLIDTRSPLLLQKATRRRQYHPELNRLRFPEICKGVPIAVNAPKKQDYSSLSSDLEIRGVPVSQGVVTGTARVANNLNEAADIQKGDILIAYCTDIAWSAYFPILSGVATELGGLISHGAVVAREYGLPCVVGVFDATQLFKTGDTVLLDGNLGILKRIEKS